MTEVQKTFRWYSLFKYVWFDTMVKPRGRCTHTLLTRRFLRGVIRIWRSHTSSIEKKIGKEFTYEDWLHCLHRSRFKTRFEICKDEDGELSDIRAIRRHSTEIIIPLKLMNYVMSHYRRDITQISGHTRKWHTTYLVDRSRDQFFFCRSWIGRRRRT